ncbi:hypothetical protein THAOC_12356, partial [Thalassiosira oceanica]
MLGSCEGTLAPSSSPVFTSSMALVADGCPPDYDENNLADIEAGDRVSLVISATPARRVVYECKSGAFSAYCSQPAFVPGGQNTAMAWDIKGYCEGTISPTASPVSYQGNCKFTKCVISKEVCSCSHSDCPSTNGQTKGCTKEVITCSEHPVEPYSRSAHYDEGDAVRVQTERFRCKGWPFSSYAPSLEEGPWNEAWVKEGSCPGPNEITIISTISLSGFSGTPSTEHELKTMIASLEESIEANLNSSFNSMGNVNSVTITKIGGVTVIDFSFRRRLMSEIQYGGDGSLDVEYNAEVDVYNEDNIGPVKNLVRATQDSVHPKVMSNSVKGPDAIMIWGAAGTSTATLTNKSMSVHDKKINEFNSAQMIEDLKSVIEVLKNVLALQNENLKI